MVVDQILKYITDQETTVDDAIRYEVEKLAGLAFRRQFMEADKKREAGSLWMSAAGKCPRQQAYAFHGYEHNGKKIDSRGRITFFQGDLIELMIIQLAKASGLSIVATGFNQTRILVRIGDIDVSGRPDGILISPDKMRVIEVKSMASYSFEKFEKGNIDDSYRAQINIYLEALHFDECIFIGLNKNNGIMKEVIIERDEELIAEIKENLLLILNSTKEDLPDKKYNRNQKGAYPWQCLYCAYWGWCHPKAEQILAGSAYKLKYNPKKKAEVAVIPETENVKVDLTYPQPKEPKTIDEMKAAINKIRKELDWTVEKMTEEFKKELGKDISDFKKADWERALDVIKEWIR